MAKFPADAPIERVMKALKALGFELVRQGNHISMIRENSDVPVPLLRSQTIKRSKHPLCDQF
jgi:predicted RNA binding protein YcfA (HicA-like mRNA interferase family)